MPGVRKADILEHFEGRKFQELVDLDETDVPFSLPKAVSPA